MGAVGALLGATRARGLMVDIGKMLLDRETCSRFPLAWASSPCRRVESPGKPSGSKMAAHEKSQLALAHFDHR